MHLFVRMGILGAGAPPPPVPTENTSMFTTATSMAAFGDSITAGQGASDPGTTSWAALVSSALGATLLNKGISGTVLQNTTSLTNNGRDRFAADLLGTNKKQKIFILYGVNDLRYNSAGYNTTTPTNFINDYREVMNGLMAGGYGHNDIVLGSPTYLDPATYNQNGPYDGASGAIQVAYTAAVAQIASEYGVFYADTYAAIRDNGGVSLLSDGIHPNDAGYVVLKTAFLAAAKNNTVVAPTITSVSSQTAYTIDVTWPSYYPGAVYTVECGVATDYTYTTSATTTGTSYSFVLGATGDYSVRIKATLPGGTVTPWTVYSGIVTVRSIDTGANTPVLDLLSATAAVAYSTRKLKTSYAGSALKVRRSSDDTTQDIGFDASGNLDTSALATFVGSNSAYVDTWYDQTGNGRHLTQATKANQPRIVNAGTIDLVNSKATVRFLGSPTVMQTANFTGVFTTGITDNFVLKVVNDGSFNAAPNKTYGMNPNPIDAFNGFISTHAGAYPTYTNGLAAAKGWNVWTLTSDSSGNWAAYFNGASDTTGTSTYDGDTTSAPLYVGTRGDGATSLDGNVGEVIFLIGKIGSTDQTTLANNQKTYWGTP